MKKPICFVLSLLLPLCLLSGCLIRRPAPGDMPFHGRIQFHDLTVVIPEEYIRDSTQSNEDFWVFEQGFGRKLILLQRSDLSGTTDEVLDSYAAAMRERGAESVRGEILLTDAVLSTYTLEDQSCREIVLVYGDSCYAFALRGGTEEEFQALLDDLNTPETLPAGT